MSLPALATMADLTARGLTPPTGVDADTILAAVSDAIRDGAGCAITQVTSTITLPAGLDRSDALKLPAGPVVSVASVAINATNVLVQGTGYIVVGDTLYRVDGMSWADDSGGSVNYFNPCAVTVTYTHGFATVPTDIVDLACALANVAFLQLLDGTYGIGNRIQSEKLGDYQLDFQRNVRGAPGAVESPSPIALPAPTRAWLRARFMGSAYAVGMRS